MSEEENQGRELIDSFNQTNRKIIKENPNASIELLMAMASLSSYTLGANVLSDCIMAQIATKGIK